MGKTTPSSKYLWLEHDSVWPALASLKLLSDTESKFVPSVVIQEDTEPGILLVINQRENKWEKAQLTGSVKETV